MDRDTGGSANCLAPGVQVGEYRLLGAIGEGGFGIVYRALDLTLDRIVAIKEYMPSTLAGRKATNQIHVRSQHRGAFDAGLRSFINEARLLAKFSHPALVHVYRFFEENGTAYMVMRHYEGQTLRAFLESHEGGVSQPWLEAMLSPILDVLEMLHAADCYHRDIAPDNIFLQDNGVPVLLDFGAARRIIGDMTQALTMVLKPGFAPIEQYVEDGAMPQGAWTDVYQIGAVIYLAITGKPPATSVARMISDPMPTLGEQNYPGYTARFYAGVQRALAVKPQDRAQSITELKAHLGIASFASPVIEPRISSGFAPLASSGGSPVSTPSPRATAGEPPTVTSAHGVERRRPTPAPSPITASQAASPDTTQAPRSPTALSTMKTVPRFSERAGPSQAAPVGLSSPFDPPVAPNGQAHETATRLAQADAANPTPATSSRPPSRQKIVALVAGLALVVLAASWWGLRSGQTRSRSELAELEEARSWQTVVEQPNAQNLAAYRAAFPNGKYREQADALVLGLMPPEHAGTDAPAAAKPDTAKPRSDAASTAEPPRAEAVRVASGAGTVPTPTVVTAAPPPLPAAPAEAKKPTPTQPAASGAASASGDAPGNALAADGAATKNSTRPSDAASQGQLLLRISPWGRVSVDHTPMGASPPLTRLDLSEGQHRVDVSNPVSKVPVTRMIWVKNGEPVVLDHRFE